MRGGRRKDIGEWKEQIGGRAQRADIWTITCQQFRGLSKAQQLSKVFEDKVERQKLGCLWVKGRLRVTGEYVRAIAQGGTEEKAARPYEKSLKGAYGDC